MDADVHSLGAAYDHSRAVIVLCGHGQSQKRALGDDAMFCHHLARDCAVDALCVQFGLCTTGMEPGKVNLYSFIGSLNKAFLRGVERDSLISNVPETVFMSFQMTFAIITPALIVGAFAERMKFSAMLWFMGLSRVLPI